MHHRVTFDECALVSDPILDGHSHGYARAPLIDASTGSPHQRLVMSELAPGGSIDPHFHSFEEVVYVLSGTVRMTLGDTEHELGRDDFALVVTGTPHSWHNTGAEPARWLEISAPQPKPPGAGFPDTFFGHREVVDADDDLFAAFDRLKIAVGGILNFAVDETVFDSGQRPAH